MTQFIIKGRTHKNWRQFDNSFVIVKNDTVSSFHYTLLANTCDPKLSFTIDVENKGQIAFLYTLVSRRNGVAIIDLYQKPTHTDW